MSINARFQFRADLAANWTANNPLLLAGELGLETDTNNFKIGNGVALWSALPYVAAGAQGPQGTPGGLGASGSASLNFGAAPGMLNTTVAVTGQASILSTSNVLVWVMGNTTANHSPDEHMLAGIYAVAENIIPGVGFTIAANAQFMLTGIFNIRWMWI